MLCREYSSYAMTTPSAISDSTAVVRDSFKALTVDEGFTVPSPDTVAALKAASALLEWCEHEENYAVVTKFSEKLVEALLSCFHDGQSRPRKREMFGKFHSLRTSQSFTELWKDFMAASIGHEAHPSFFQFVTDVVFQQLVKHQFPTIRAEGDDENAIPPMTQEELNALHYVAGYVCRKIRHRLESSSHPQREDMILCILELSGDQSDDCEDGSEEWTNSIDRGGLWHLSDEAFTLFTIMEKEVRQVLSLRNASKQKEGCKSQLVNMLLKSEDVLFQWCILMCDTDGDATPLLQMIVELFVTIRGFSFTISCLELYKKAERKALQRSKGLRNEIFTSKV